MFRRYLIPCASLLLAAFGVACAVYLLSPAPSRATCAFRITVPVSADVRPGSGYYQLNANVVTTELGRAFAFPLFSEVAKDQGISAVDLAGRSRMDFGQSFYFAKISVSDRTSEGAIRLANALCDQLAIDVPDQRRRERETQATALRDQLVELTKTRDALAAKPNSTLTPSETQQLNSTTAAIRTDEAELAKALSLTPDIIEVAAHATTSTVDRPDLGRIILVAAAAGVLSCFLVVLLGEWRRGAALPRPVVGDEVAHQQEVGYQP